MPKAKPKVPKTEKMWMGWEDGVGFIPDYYADTKEACLRECPFHDTEAVPVRIMPEAEYQRLRKAAKP